MIEMDILSESDRVELLQGEIIEMSPIVRQHAACVDRFTELFVQAFATQAIVRVQNPIRLGNTSEPQPDFAILQRRPDFYAEGHPQPSDIFALIEIADTTIEFDRTVKIPLYAQENIPEVWIVDLNAQVVEVYREPSPDGYQQTQIIQRGKAIAFQAFSNRLFFVDQLLG